jgi:hypothetical protein
VWCDNKQFKNGEDFGSKEVKQEMEKIKIKKRRIYDLLVKFREHPIKFTSLSLYLFFERVNNCRGIKS